MILTRSHYTSIEIHHFHPRSTMPERVRFEAENLRWIKPRLFGNQYELHCRQGHIGTLTLSGFFRPSARCEGIDGRWEIEPLRRDSGTIIVRAKETFQEVGAFDMKYSPQGGILRTADGQALLLDANFWEGRAEFQTPLGEPLIRFRYHGFIHPSAEVEILNNAARLRGLPWIIMLGWCLIVGYL